MGYYVSRRAMERNIGDEKSIYYKLDEQKYYSKYAIQRAVQLSKILYTVQI